ncbi:MAG: hypothetical protein ACRCYE_14985 [Sarcina sp.]
MTDDEYFKIIPKVFLKLMGILLLVFAIIVIYAFIELNINVPNQINGNKLQRISVNSYMLDMPNYDLVINYGSREASIVTNTNNNDYLTYYLNEVTNHTGSIIIKGKADKSVNIVELLPVLESLNFTIPNGMKLMYINELFSLTNNYNQIYEVLSTITAGAGGGGHFKYGKLLTMQEYENILKTNLGYDEYISLANLIRVRKAPKPSL